MRPRTMTSTALAPSSSAAARMTARRDATDARQSDALGAPTTRIGMTTSVTPARGARCARGVSARALARADDARRATHARGAASNAMDKTRGETTTTTTTRRSGGRRRDARARASADDVEERVTSTRETTTGRFGNGNTRRAHGGGERGGAASDGSKRGG